MHTAPTFLRRVVIQNYKSIRAADVQLGPLTVLVGPNGSGKSNFLDSLRFTADALSTTLDHALRERGGVNEVRRRSGGHPNHFTVRLEMELPGADSAHFSYKVGATGDGGFRVTDEECQVTPGLPSDQVSYYRVRHGVVSTSLEVPLPPPSDDRLFLVSASAVRPFRQVYDRLTGMGFYNLVPAQIRSLQQPDPGTLLRRDGSNLASVLGRLEKLNPVVMERVVEYMQRVAPGVTDVTRRSVGAMETLEFKQEVEGQAKDWKFPASSMSDGTLRGLGVLVALLQASDDPPSLVGIEEPEVALHPAAVGVLFDAIRDATVGTQVVVTSHSPELLDRPDLGEGGILAVTSEGGVTRIGRVDPAVRSALRDRLFTPGELLRMNQLDPSTDPEDVAPAQLRFFELT